MIEQLQEISKGVSEGNLDPLKTYIDLKKFEGWFKEVMKLVQDKAIDEARKYDQKTFKAFGAEVQLKSNPGTWDYKHSELWNFKKNDLKAFEEQMQSAFHAQKKGNTIVAESGEIVEPAFYKPGADNISIKLLKTE